MSLERADTRIDMKDEFADHKHPLISVGVINYNGGETLANTVRSILSSNYPEELEVLVVDDGSKDNSLELLMAEFPQVVVHRQPKNMGPNAARNVVLNKSSHDIILVTDNDVEFAPNCLSLLAEEIVSNPMCAVTTPMILDFYKRDQVYSNGAELHFVCFGVLQRHHTLPPNADFRPRPTVCGSGGIMLVKKQAALAIGGFDENFTFGYDDGEFTYRITLAGYDVIQVPSSRIYHIEKDSRDPKKLRFQVSGRWNLILKTYALRSLVFLTPALLLFEISQVVFLLLKRSFGEWTSGWKLVLGNWNGLMTKRRKTMLQKKRADKDTLCAGEIFIFPSRTNGKMLLKIKKVIEIFLNCYWTLVRPLLRK
ncbi:MAG TPA: glycosyltransferase family 2 protein [Nitrospinota bacterium]|nr:glycosyltransferase family 2 protein [Nitrospinota bacterium]